MVAILVAACSNPSGSTASTQSKEIEIASELPLSDGGAPGARRAVEAAIAEHAMVHGYRLVHKSFDDSLAGTFSRERALQNAKLMVRDPQIVGVVGPWNSLAVQLAVPVTAQHNLVMISPSATRDCLTAQPKACLNGPNAPATAKNFFRLVARNSISARSAADFAIGKLGVKRFAVLAWDDPESHAIGEAFRSELELMGGMVLFRRFYSPTDLTYAPLLREARDSGAKAVYVVWGHTSDGTCRVRATMNGIFPADAYLISSDSITDDECIVESGGAANEYLVATISASLPATTKGTSVPARSVNLTTAIPYVYAAYDCAQILIAAIDRAIVDNGGKFPTREQVLRAVAATKEYKGITGTYSFDANGDPINPAVSIYHVIAGKWTWWQNYVP